MFSLTRRHVEQFSEDGFLIVERLLDDRLVDSLRGRFDRLVRGEFETGITPDEVNWQEGQSDPSLTRQICNAWKADRVIAGAVMRADIGQAIAQLGDWPGTRIMHDNVLWKPPGARPVGHHQDNAYLHWFRPTELLSCWMALDETSSGGGTVEFVRGSHRWHHSSPEGEFHGPAEYRKHVELAAAREGIEPEYVRVEVPKGGGSFHHGWTWHGSGHNTTERHRRALVLHAMRSDAEFVPGQLREGIGRIYSRYKRLADNLMDENHFPVLWRNDGYRTPEIDTFIQSREVQ